MAKGIRSIARPGSGLAHDGLGPADGVDRGGGGHHPVGPAQRRDGPHGQQVGSPGPTPTPTSRPGDRRVGRGRRGGGRDRLGQGGFEGGPDEVGLGPPGLGGPARPDRPSAGR